MAGQETEETEAEEPIHDYVIDSIKLGRIEHVMQMLYSDRPLTPDQRRDCANILDAVTYAIRLPGPLIPK